MTTIHLVGNLTSAPELRYTQNGKPVASVTVAENVGKDDNKRSFFHRVTAWEALAENIAALDKGQRVIVIGRLEQREYQDRDGNTRQSWEIIADEVSPSLRFKPRDDQQQPVEAWTGDRGVSTGGNGGYADGAPF